MVGDPESGIGARSAAAKLNEALTSLRNLAGVAEGERYFRYYGWARDSAFKLDGVITRTEIDRLIFTPAYYALLSSGSPDWGPTAGTVEMVMRRAETELRATIESLQSTSQRWTAPGRLIVADTNVYLHGPGLGEFSAKTLIGEDVPARLLVPMIVIDELDALKNRGEKDRRQAARQALKMIEQALDESPAMSGELTVRPGRSRLAIEVVPDPPGRLRLPVADDEIVDRAAYFERLAGRKVVISTLDTGMTMRCRNLRIESRTPEVTAKTSV